MLIKINSEEDTTRYGLSLASQLSPGEVVCLVGDLGTGKTALTKAIAEGLGVTEHIVSPTFNIVKEYHSGRMPLYHFDVYRVSDPDELFEIGAEEYFYGEGVCIVEWADLIPDMIPSGSRVIEISYGEAPQERIYDIGWTE
ncbi:MAG: tRNA (adenosine(37)-N6)-threonylcarbamoyltransferase complex ATPase subunit type 1 TsaE [Firmicutes bacterium]|nr:tRNA (adenosine(37)-N6)-threonylcarbamoyltransferase complex ATPase subunit type 1 TsaE [Bacillota bacterium]